MKAAACAARNGFSARIDRVERWRGALKARDETELEDVAGNRPSSAVERLELQVADRDPKNRVSRLDSLAPPLPRRQDGARPLDVARHFGLQRLQRIELEFVSDAGDEFDAHLATINVATKIKQICLQ